MGALWRKLRVFMRRGQLDRELEEEMRFHLEMKTQELGDAWRARREFGNPTLLREISGEAWSWRWLEALGQDLRYALRMMRRSPWFSTVVVVVLALGIGGSTTVFSLVNALLLNPFPYPQPDRLVAVWTCQRSEQRKSVRIRDFFDWREQNAVFEEMAVYGWFRSNVTGLPEPERMIGGTASSGFLRVLGVQPAMGRFFTPAEDLPGGPAVVVLNYSMWKRQFGSRADVLGRTLTVGSRPHTIIGVMPARFALPGMFTCEFWRPAAYDPASSRGTWMDGDHMIARLRGGISVARAQADLAVIAGRVEEQYPEGRGWGALVEPIGKELAEAASEFIAAPALAVLLLLLLACANLAGLLLARGTARAKEMALRTSLGAARGRLVQQMLTETVLVSLCGGVLGLLLAQWGIGVLIAAAPPYAGLGSALRIDGTVLAFAVAVSLLTGICFGLVPALYGSKPDLNSVLKGAGATVASRPRSRFISGLVVVQVALALVVLIGGGLMLKSLGRLLQVDLGVQTTRVLTFRLGLSEPRYRLAQRRDEFFRKLLERLRSIPGILDASSVSPLPLSGEYSGGGFTIEGRPAPQRWQDMAAQYCQAAPGYFGTMGIPVVLGREFDERDQSGASPVVIVNQTLARRFFPHESPIGRRINRSEVVGVVGDVRHNGPAKDAHPQIYSPLARPWGAYVVVRTKGDPARLVRSVRGEVRALDPDLPLDRLKSMEQVVSDSIAAARMISSILGGFGVFALVLVALGIYGVIAYSASQRTHEIGVRVALGASPASVLGPLVRKGVLLTLSGVAIGLPVALVTSRVVESLLYGVKPRGFGIFAGVSLGLTAVALLAGYIPARRAASIHPMEALRYE